MSDRLQIQPHKHLEAMVLPPKAASAIQGTKPTKPKTWFSGSLSIEALSLDQRLCCRASEFSIYVYLLRAYCRWTWPWPNTPSSSLLWTMALSSCFSCCWLCCHIIQFPNGHHNTCVFCKKPSSAFSPHLEWNPNSLSKFIEH